MIIGMRNNAMRKRGVMVKTPILPFWGFRRIPYRSLKKVAGLIEISDIKICMIFSTGFIDPDARDPEDAVISVVTPWEFRIGQIAHVGNNGFPVIK